MPQHGQNANGNRHDQAAEPRLLPREIHDIRLEPARHLVYAPLAKCAFVTNAAGVNSLADLRESGHAVTAAQLDLAAFLAAIGFTAAAEQPPPSGPDSPTFAPTTVTLLLTNACNLRCTYCYARAGDAPRQDMDLDTARRAIAAAFANAQAGGSPRIDIAYHGGGEPALAWPVLTASADYAARRGRDLGLEVRATCATNGVLSRARAEWIAGNLHGSTVSLDGLPAVHDQCRRTHRGKGSSAAVMRTLRVFEQRGHPYGIRMTVTPEHTAALPESVRFIAAEFRPESVQVEPVYQLGRWQEHPCPEVEAFVAAYRAAKRVARQAGLQLRFSAVRPDVITNHFCMATQTLFAVTPSGSITACYECFSPDQPAADAFFIGKLATAGPGYRIDTCRLQRLRQQGVESLSSCRDCFARWHCAGDCCYKRIVGERLDGGERAARCRIIRELLVDEILARIADGPAGMAWSGRSAVPPGRAGAV